VISRTRGKTLRDNLGLNKKYYINDIHLDGTGKMIAQLRTPYHRVFIDLDLLEMCTE